MPGRPGVAIVGAGPAGLVIAHLLQREAIPFVVFERQAPADLGRPKAGLVEYRTVQRLAREGIAGSVVQFTTENHRSEFRAEAFSSWFLHVLLTSLRDGKEPSEAAPGGFSHGLRHGSITALQNDPLFARWFAHAYAGVDPG